MSAGGEKLYRLSQVARKLNVGVATIVDHLRSQSYEISTNPNEKITQQQYEILAHAFSSSLLDKEEASSIVLGSSSSADITIETQPHQDRPGRKQEEEIHIKNLSNQAIKRRTLAKKKESEEEEEETQRQEVPSSEDAKTGLRVVGKIDLSKPTSPGRTTDKDASSVSKPADADSQTAKPKKKKETKAPIKDEVIRAKATPAKDFVVLDKIQLKEEPKRSSREKVSDEPRKRRRKRVSLDTPYSLAEGKRRDKTQKGSEGAKEKHLSDKEIRENIKATMARLMQSTGGPSAGSKLRSKKEKSEVKDAASAASETNKKTLSISPYSSVSDMASLMNVSVNEVISVCMGLGLLVSINQRLDTEAITVIADEFDYEVAFTSADDETALEEEVKEEDKDAPARAPIVTIMGHVDHGKTSLLDFIRQTKVSDAEAGGITQHIGAYEVITRNQQRIVFLDTPGHAAFTAMRARGARLTDIAVIVIAADDEVRPQTEEAINHVKVAGVPFLIALNKIDKETAQPDKIRESLSKMNILVEEWGGKYQCQEISAKKGTGIDELLEKVLLEAELLELRAKPDCAASGTVLEASLDKGRGYVATLIVERGTLKTGDIILSGTHYGRVKAMFNHQRKRLNEAPPATPVQVLGLNGAPPAGDRFKVVKIEREAREVAAQRNQMQREQRFRTRKHITLDEIGRRLAVGSFKEMNIVLKGDVVGSVEAIADALEKLSGEEVQLNIIHKSVGQISESDVLLASASDAIVIGFQVRPSEAARRLIEKEGIDVRLHSVIFDLINEIKDAIEGMLAPTVEEQIKGNLVVKQVFKISKIGTVAGCEVSEGSIKREHPIRVIRDGIVIHTGQIQQLKRFKEDVQEVKKGHECGVAIKDYTQIQAGDMIESFERREIKRVVTQS